MYSIKLSDGTIIDNLILNGNNFISDTLIEEAMFVDNLSEVEISDGENIRIYYDMYLVQIMIFGDKWWFILDKKSEEQKEKELLNSKISELQEIIDVMLNGVGGEIV